MTSKINQRLMLQTPIQMTMVTILSRKRALGSSLDFYTSSWF